MHGRNLTVQCLLGVRITSVEALNEKLQDWHLARNSKQKGV